MPIHTSTDAHVEKSRDIRSCSYEALGGDLTKLIFTVLDEARSGDEPTASRWT
jgi:hypothetical protein